MSRVIFCDIIIQEVIPMKATLIVTFLILGTTYGSYAIALQAMAL